MMKMVKPKKLPEMASIKVRLEDIKRFDEYKDYETEPRWFTFKRILDVLEDMKKTKHCY